MKPRMARYPGGLALAGLCLLVLSCGGGNNVLRIQTNVPALAGLSGRYMAESGTPLIEIEYRDQLTVVDPNGHGPDLVIGTGLYTSQAMDNMASQSELFGTDPLDATEYYPFSFVKHKDVVCLSVLSWDLPAIITPLADSGHDFTESVALPLEGLMDRAAQYNQKKKGSYRALGFSPLFSDEFMYLMLQYGGARLGSDRRGYPDWRDDRLTAMLQTLALWSTTHNDGPGTESAFIAKFAYEPVNQLLANQRFAYAYSRASDFLAADQAPGTRLNLHWASWQNRLMILDNLVMAGIPQQSGQKAEALRFIRWLLSPAVQKRAIVDALDQGARSFGFLGGFSSCRDITEKIIPRYYPAVRLRIPPEPMLDFPEPQGMLWTSFKRDILAPWVRDQLLNPGQAGESLHKSVSKWLLQMGLNP